MVVGTSLPDRLAGHPRWRIAPLAVGVAAVAGVILLAGESATARNSAFLIAALALLALGVGLPPRRHVSVSSSNSTS
jgi:dipeptide/tripeptide permease